MILSLVIFSMVGGIAVTKFGYYTPFVIASSILMSIGAGLLSTFHTDTGHSKWIGYQDIYGLGAGMFLTTPLISVQAVLDSARTPVGISTATFFQMFGGAFTSAISQTMFNEKLLKQLVKNVPDADIGKLLAAGTIGVQKVVTPEQLPGVLRSYNEAILDPFYLAAAVTAVAFFCGFGLEWVSMKGKNVTVGEAA